MGTGTWLREIWHAGGTWTPPALVAALEEGRIGGAALDVTDP